MKRASLYSDEHAALVQLLRDLRMEAGLSQERVAKLLRRPQTYVSAVEVGQRGLDLLQVRELAAVYGVSFPDFARTFDDRLRRGAPRAPRIVRKDAAKKGSKTGAAPLKSTKRKPKGR